MLSLSKGNYTGRVIQNINQVGCSINTVHYALEDEPVGTHYHENPHICFLLQGGDHETRKGHSYERKSGDVFFYRAGEPHASIAKSRLTKSLVIEFEQPFLQQYGVAEMQIETAIKHNADVKFQLLQILHETYEAKTSELDIQTLLLELVGLPESRSAKSIPRWVQVIDDLLHAQWNQPITLQALSLAAQVHPVTISKQFVKYYHCTLAEYLRKLKIENSIPLIKNTPMSLTEIAYHCGFADQSHFTRTFKRITGFLPKDFRRV